MSWSSIVTATSAGGAIVHAADQTPFVLATPYQEHWYISQCH